MLPIRTHRVVIDDELDTPKPETDDRTHRKHREKRHHDKKEKHKTKEKKEKDKKVKSL